MSFKIKDGIIIGSSWFVDANRNITANGVTINGGTAWHSGNDGSGSGLDADKLDNMEPSTVATGSTIVQRDGNGDFAARNIVSAISDANYRNILNPGGATYNTQTATVTGAIAVVLPVGMTNTMLRMTIRIYEYATNESFDVYCGGYPYNGGNTWANSPFAYIVGNPTVDRRFNVRFGYTSGGKAVVYIGETGSTWSFPQIAVTDVQCGYGGNSVSYTSGWNITFVTAFENVTATVANCQVGYATSTNMGSAVVLRDGSGNFSAGTITANLTGTATKATNVVGGAQGSIPYQTAADTTSLLAKGSAFQVLAMNSGATAPSWVTLDMTYVPGATFKKSVRVATTADLGASARTTTTLTGYSPSVTLACTTTLSSTTVTTTSTAGIKVGATLSGNANIPAGATVSSITNATTFVISAAATAAATSVNTTFTQTIAALVVDGVTVALNDRILVKDQTHIGGLDANRTDNVDNGIYYVSTLGTSAVAWVLTRAADADTSAEIASAMVAVDEGTTHGGWMFDNDFKTTDTLGTTAMVWSPIADSGKKLSFFAATTSAELKGVISDETGSGALVFASSPALAGTPTAPTAAVGTNTTQIATTAYTKAEIAAVAAPLSHNHTTLTGVTSIGFAADASDSASITTTINANGTYFDFNLTDDNNNDWWRWRFTPSGSTVYDAMVLKPVANGSADLTVSGKVSAPTLVSTVATGTAPLTVASATVVPSLNSDLLDDLHGSAYMRYAGWIASPGYDANAIGENQSGFTYMNNAPQNGPLVHHAAGGYGLQINASYATGHESLYFRTRNGDTALWNAWHKIWTADNDGSGSGLDADLLEGYHADTAATANTIVRRNGSGYIYGTYINSSRGDEATAAASYIYDTGDGWMRKKTVANTRAELVTSAAVSTAIGYTPVNKAGDSMSGLLTADQGVTSVNAHIKVYNGYNFLAYSDAGVTEMINLDGALGNVLVEGYVQAGANGFKIKTATATKTIVTVKDGDANGIGIAITGGGATIIGGGESATACLNGVTATTENMYVTSDNDILFYTNGNTWTSAKLALTLDNTGLAIFGGNIKLPSGGEIHSGYNNAAIIKDHANGHVTLSAAGGSLYLGYSNSVNVKLYANLVANDTNSNTLIADATGKLYYKGNDTDSRYVQIRDVTLATDWNTLRTSDVFNVSTFTNNTNTPSGAYDYGTLAVFRGLQSDSQGVGQLYMSHNNSELWYRGGWNTSWVSWVKVWTSGNFDPATKANSSHSHSYSNFGVTNTSNSNGYGISLYNGAVAGQPTYGLMFAGTGTFGTCGGVTGDWATYFTMNGGTGRGWIFRNVDTGVNVASVNNVGNAYFYGTVENGSFDFVLGTRDQSSRGNTGASRALVKETGGILGINFAEDFYGGTRIYGYTMHTSGASFSGGLNIAGDGNMSIELRSNNGGSPFIDFTRDSGTDFHSRFIANGSNGIDFHGPNYCLNVYNQRSVWIVMDATGVGGGGSEPTIRPGSNDFGFLGTSGYKWYRIWSGASLQTSDRERKTEISSYDTRFAYEYLQDMNFYLYRHLDGEDKTRGDLQIGTMIDELPLEVVTADTEGGDGKSLDMYSYASFMAGALKEAIKEIENLKLEVARMKGEIV